jgi:hypothetical protein
MGGRRTLGWLGIGVVVLVVGVTSPVGATGESPSQSNKLYREDAFADFVVHHGDCDLERTELQVGVLQTVFTDFLASERTVREVQFGVGIEEFDCFGQFVGAEGNDVGSAGFDVTAKLESSEVHATLTACPSAGASACFPVRIDLFFTGVGPIDHDEDRDLITEPGCTINNRFVTDTRAALVVGTVGYTMPGQPTRTFELSSDDLSPVGAYLSNHSERHFLRGDTGSCVEITA